MMDRQGKRSISRYQRVNIFRTSVWEPTAYQFKDALVVYYGGQGSPSESWLMIATAPEFWA